MSKTISDLWKEQSIFLQEKTLEQIIAITGDGKLRDGSVTSLQFREFLNILPTAMIEKFVNQCLETKSENTPFALQDLINETGARLGFQVEFGLYKGKKNIIGNDGLWKSTDSSIVVEVKMTDTFRIRLDSIAKYRNRLIEEGKVKLENSSILIIVGREDTGELEAQIRGSKHAWDIRLISIEALLKLLKLKEDLLDDESVFKYISRILKPLEFTRLDELIETIFITGVEAKDAGENEKINVDEHFLESTAHEAIVSNAPANFNELCVSHIQKFLGVRLKKQTKTLYVDEEQSSAITCAVSKNHADGAGEQYWFAFHEHQKESLSKYREAHVCFGCGSESALIIFVLEYREFLNYTDKMSTSNRPSGKMYWHVKIRKIEDKYMLLGRDDGNIDITDRVLALQ